MRFIFGLLFIFSLLLVEGQDTIRLMQYNLLMYGNDYGGCTQSNNNVSNKNEYLKTIVDYVKPDILAVNEIYRESYYHDLLLNNVFNLNGVNYFQRGYPPNNSNGFTLNNVFYDSRKLEMIANSVAATGVRDIDLFRFKYKYGPYADSSIFLNCLVAHLKAGQYSENERASQVFSMMQYLSNSTPGNYIFSGDFNIYNSSEGAFQYALFYPDEEVRFYDPTNRIGDWNGNPYFADVHTQSTHTNGGCPSGGGLDDRFDFILISDEILYGSDGIILGEDSYQTIGQDGLHYNSSITSTPTNLSAPANVISALYSMSDHLPIVIDLVIGGNLSARDQNKNNLGISFENPVINDLRIKCNVDHPGEYQIILLDLPGKCHFSKIFTIDDNFFFTIPVDRLPNGMYMLHFISEDHGFVAKKVIISN